MRYSDRVTLIKVETVNGPLGQTETETRYDKACAAQRLSFEENATIYGEAAKNTMKLHFPSHEEGYARAEYDGETYDIYLERHFRRHSVLYLTGDGR